MFALRISAMEKARHRQSELCGWTENKGQRTYPAKDLSKKGHAVHGHRGFFTFGLSL
jgi:hypothetical protein